MNPVRKLIVPLLAALAALSLALVTLTPGAAADRDQTNPEPALQTGELARPAVIPRQAPVIVLNGNDFPISGASGFLPEIAASNQFVAVVYEKEGIIYLRSAVSVGFGLTIQVDPNIGRTPKVAFDPNQSNKVHIVWEGGNGRLIRHKSCTLRDPTPVCGTLHTVAIDNAFNNLHSPDVVVDNDGDIHVVWLDSNLNNIYTSRSDNGGLDWSNPVLAYDIVGSPDDLIPSPVLAAAGSYIHLAFVNRSPGGVYSIEYRRSLKGADNWNSANTTIEAIDSVILGYSELNNPTIAATGSKVYIAWDSKFDNAPNTFGLMGIVNNSSGNTGNWPLRPNHITSTNPANGQDLTNRRLSRDTDVPPVENNLRPSVAVTSTDFGIVWQERPDPVCQSGEGDPTNGSTEIFYASLENDDWDSTTGQLDNEPDYAVVDPDLAANSAGEHVVFMKAEIITGQPCSDGAESPQDLSVYYRGPWGKDSPNVKKIVFPIIEK